MAAVVEVPPPPPKFSPPSGQGTGDIPKGGQHPGRKRPRRRPQPGAEGVAHWPDEGSIWPRHRGHSTSTECLGQERRRRSSVLREDATRKGGPTSGEWSGRHPRRGWASYTREEAEQWYNERGWDIGKWMTGTSDNAYQNSRQQRDLQEGEASQPQESHRIRNDPWRRRRRAG